jgi:hypothetical protein
MAYVAALGIAAFRIYTSIGERLSLAEREINNIADIASAADASGFLGEPFREMIQRTLVDSQTLEGLIVSGSQGQEAAFERRQGSVIAWDGDTPRFKFRFGITRIPYFRNIPNGIRNATLRGVSNYIAYDECILILKHTLLVVLAALALAFFLLILDLALGKETPPQAFSQAPPVSDRESFRNGESLREQREEPAPFPIKANEPGFSPTAGGPREREPFKAEEPPDIPDIPDTFEETAGEDDDDDISLPDIDFEFEDDFDADTGETPRDALEPPADEARQGESPQGLYSPHGNIGWEAYTKERLESELHRCASFDQDLALIVMEFKDTGKPGGEVYKQFADAAVGFFNLRDLIFEKGERGIAVILPNTDLEQGFSKSEEFHNRVLSSMAASFTARTDLCIGLSSRSGRLIEADRILLEASQALERALTDPVSPIVAFKSDPEKYRAFIRTKGIN